MSDYFRNWERMSRGNWIELLEWILTRKMELCPLLLWVGAPGCSKPTCFDAEDITNQHAREMGPHEQCRDWFQGMVGCQVKFIHVGTTSGNGHHCRLPTCLFLLLSLCQHWLMGSCAASWICFQLASKTLFFRVNFQLPPSSWIWSDRQSCVHDHWHRAGACEWGQLMSEHGLR